MKGYSAYHCDPEHAILSPKPAFLYFPAPGLRTHSHSFSQILDSFPCLFSLELPSLALWQ